jgi:pectate lyase-like protein
LSTTITYTGIRIVDMPDLGAVTDTSSVVGEHAGSGRFSAPQFRNYNNLVVATGSTIPRSNADRWGAVANVFDYGAIGDGVANDTAAIQAAVASGKRVYMPRPSVAFRVTNAINCTTKGQIIEGDGKGVTIIAIGSDFNLSALGVFVMPAAPWVPGPQFRDFQINFAQPDTTTYASLVAYPVAFYAQGIARATWHGIKINAAMKGIDLRANGAGTSMVDCELCCFDWHIYLDGEADSVTVQNCRFENDSLTANQGTIYHASSVGIITGRCDDLHVIGCLFLCFQGIHAIVGSDGNNTFGNITNTDFDTYSGIKVDAANLQVAGCGFTLGTADSVAVSMAAGNMSMSACWFLSSLTLTNAMITTSAPVEVRLQIAGSRFDAIGVTPVVNAYQNSTIVMTGCDINLQPVARGSVPAVTIDNAALLTMSGCRFSPKGGGSGAAINLVIDGTHNVCGNAFGGWSAGAAAGALHILANNNP